MSFSRGGVNPPLFPLVALQRISMSDVYVGFLNQAFGRNAPPVSQTLVPILQPCSPAILRISPSTASWSSLGLKGTVWVSGFASPGFQDLTATSTSTMISSFSASTKRVDVLLATQPYLWWRPWGGSCRVLLRTRSIVFFAVSWISRQGEVFSAAAFICGMTSPSRSNSS